MHINIRIPCPKPNEELYYELYSLLLSKYLIVFKSQASDHRVNASQYSGAFVTELLLLEIVSLEFGRRHCTE